jgi:hypothetical protein
MPPPQLRHKPDQVAGAGFVVPPSWWNSMGSGY